MLSGFYESETVRLSVFKEEECGLKRGECVPASVAPCLAPSCVPKGRWFGSQLGRVWEAVNGRFSLTSMFLLPSLPLPSSLSEISAVG